MGLRLRPVAASRGQAWLREGFRAYFHHPLGYSLLFFAFLLTSALLGSIPLLGPWLATSLLPLLSLLFMGATQDVQQGRPIGLAHWFALWREPPRRLRTMLLLCGAYGLLVTAIVALAFWSGGDELRQAFKPLARPQSGAQEMMEVFGSAAVARLANTITLLVALVSVPYWHALALVRWGGQGAFQALFSSTIALWRTRGAVLLYGLSWIGCTLLGSLLAGLLSALLAAGGGGALALLPGLLIMLSLSSAFYASLWFMFIDTFAPDDAGAGTSAP